MKLSKHLLYSATAFITIATIGALTSPKLAAAAKAAYVEVVMPGQPYFQFLLLKPGTNSFFGPYNGKLGVTNLMLTNSNSNAVTVHIYRPSAPDVDCREPLVPLDEGGVASVIVQGNSTVVVTYPTPLVIDSSVGGHACLGAFAGGSGPLSMYVSGFVN